MKIYHNENDDRCCEVLERHFPDSVVDRRSIEDVKTEDLKAYRQCHFFAGIGGFSEAFRRAGVGADCNVWTGGFPCQDLSVAGQRAGLAGGRSGLYFDFQRLVAQSRPELVIAENVPGLLSSNGGKDFAIVVGGLTGRIPAVPVDGWGSAGFFRGRVYSVAYRILDAQYFGVAQRRRRVFIVASLGNGRCAEILFEREGLFGNPPARREAGERTAGTLNARTKAGGFPRTDEALGGYLTFGGGNTSGPIDVATARNVKGDTRLDFDTETFVVEQNNVASTPDMVSLRSNPAQPVVLAFAERTRAVGRNLDVQEELAYALTNPGNGGRGDNRQIAGDFGVRRLTPTECERLQGFEDGWTAGQADSSRYRQLGNAVAVPVAEWIARRIVVIQA